MSNKANKKNVQHVTKNTLNEKYKNIQRLHVFDHFNDLFQSNVFALITGSQDQRFLHHVSVTYCPLELKNKNTLPIFGPLYSISKVFGLKIA